METFFMVYLEGGQTPAHKHRTLELAQVEAERLMVAHHKNVAYVLQPILKAELTQSGRWTYIDSGLTT